MIYFLLKKIIIFTYYKIPHAMKKKLFLLVILPVSLLYAQNGKPRNPSFRYGLPVVFSHSNEISALSPSNETRIALDSMLHFSANQLEEREIFKYDSLGNNIESISYAYVDTILDYGEKIERNYNSEGLILTRILSEYDVSSQSWEYGKKEEYFYDSSSHLDSVNYYKYDNGNWELHHYIRYAYDANDYLTQKTTYFFNSETSSWTPQSRKLFYYSSDMLIRIINQSYSSGAWKNKSKTELNYNVANLIAEIIYYDYDTTQNTWIPDTKDVIEYNSSDQPTTYTFYNYDSNNGWEKDERFLFNFDTAGDLTKLLLQEYFSSTWLDIYYTDYVHDTSVEYDQLLLPLLFSEDEDEEFSVFTDKIFFSHKLDSLHSFEKRNSVWEDQGYSLLYYSTHEVVLSLKELQSHFTVYPNPFHDQLFIKRNSSWEIDRVEIRDLQGRLIKRWINQPDAYDLSNIGPGIYLLGIESDNKHIIYKILKE